VTTARTVRTVEKGDWKAIFLKALAVSGVVTTACKKAKIGRTTAYKTRDEDEAFAQAWDDALDDALDGMEEEVYRRGVEGVLKPVYQGGKKVGSIREYSDTLLIFRLKAERPEKYRERTDVRHSGKIDVSRLSDAELQSITEN
jgi:hypothetical protein